jgi:AraC-like DNA-binding protein
MTTDRWMEDREECVGEATSRGSTPKMAAGSQAVWPSQRYGIERTVIRIAEALLGQLVEPTPERVAELLETKRADLERSFSEESRTALEQFLLSVQIARAKQLFLDPRRPLAEVVYASGFISMAAFASSFRKLVGVSPGRWRRQFRPATGEARCRPACGDREPPPPLERQDLRNLLGRLSGRREGLCRSVRCDRRSWRAARAAVLVDLLTLVSDTSDWNDRWERVFLRMLISERTPSVSELGGQDFSARTFLRAWGARITITPGQFMQLLRLRLVELSVARGATVVSAARRHGFASATYYYACRRRVAGLAKNITAERGTKRDGGKSSLPKICRLWLD